MMGFNVYFIAGEDPEKFEKLVRTHNINAVYFVWGEKPNLIKEAYKAGACVFLLDISGRMVDPEVSKLIERHLTSKMCAVRYKKWYRMSNEEFHKNHIVAYAPVDLAEIESYWLSEAEILKRRRELGIGPNDLVIGRVGRPEPGKWGDMLIDMMPYLVKKIPNVKFVVMGCPEAKKEKIKKKGLENYFIFLDPDPADRAVIELLSLIDVYAYSSANGESFGWTIAEAMACKKPVVVNSTPLVDNAQIELVDNGKTGFVVYSPKAFAEAIAFLAINRTLAREMGLTGYRKVKREYEAAKGTKMVEKRILDLLIARGVKINNRTQSRYEKVVQFPSRKEIDDFEDEYEHRLKDVVGKPDLVGIFIGKHVSFSPVAQRFIRSTRLTNLRNVGRRFVEKR